MSMRSLIIRCAVVVASVLFVTADAVAQSTPTPTGSGTPANACPTPTGKPTNYDLSSAQATLNGANGGWIGPTHECAALVQSLSPGLGLTRTWEKGDSVGSGNVAYGTPIATFGFDRGGNFVGQGNGSKYTPPGTGGISGKSHTAIYLGTNADGSIKVLEQWNNRPAQIADLPPGNCERCAGAYSAIAGAQSIYPDSGNQKPNPDGTTPTQPGQPNPDCPPQQQQQPQQQSQTGLINPEEVSRKVQEILGAQCWSCEIYKALVKNVSRYVQQSYEGITGGGSASGSVALLAVSIFTLVFGWKILLMFSTPFEAGASSAQRWSDLVRYTARAGFAATLLFGAAAAQSWGGSTNLGAGGSGQVNVVRDFLIDGPILAGTTIGCELMTKGTQAFGVGGAISCAKSGGDWVQQHVSDATTILKGFHDVGVGGIAVGAYLIADAAQFLQSAFANMGSQVMSTISGALSPGNLLKIFVIALSGLALILTFFAFTMSFGLRFVDALLRALVAMSLAPLLVILWVFDKTRPMAIAGFKAVLFLGAVFIVTGLAYSFAAFIVLQGLQMAGLGPSLATANIAAAGPAMLGGQSGAGGATFLGINMAGKAADIKWEVFFILLASWSLAMGMAQSSFQIAEQLIAFGSNSASMGQVNAGAAASSQVDQTAQAGVDQARRQAGGFLGRMSEKAGRGMGSVLGR